MSEAVSRELPPPTSGTTAQAIPARHNISGARKRPELRHGSWLRPAAFADATAICWLSHLMRLVLDDPELTAQNRYVADHAGIVCGRRRVDPG
jgi:uncharacterized protein YecE (DUF72 family)